MVSPDEELRWMRRKLIVDKDDRAAHDEVERALSRLDGLRRDRSKGVRVGEAIDRSELVAVDREHEKLLREEKKDRERKYRERMEAEEIIDRESLLGLIKVAKLSIWGIVMGCAYLIGSFVWVLFVRTGDDPFWDPFFDFLGYLLNAFGLLAMLMTMNWHLTKQARDRELRLGDG